MVGMVDGVDLGHLVDEVGVGGVEEAAGGVAEQYSKKEYPQKGTF